MGPPGLGSPHVCTMPKEAPEHVHGPALLRQTPVRTVAPRPAGALRMRCPGASWKAKMTKRRRNATALYPTCVVPTRVRPLRIWSAHLFLMKLKWTVPGTFPFSPPEPLGTNARFSPPHPPLALGGPPQLGLGAMLGAVPGQHVWRHARDPHLREVGIHRLCVRRLLRRHPRGRLRQVLRNQDMRPGAQHFDVRRIGGICV